MTKRTTLGLLTAMFLLLGVACSDDDSDASSGDDSSQEESSNDGGTTDEAVEDLGDAIDELDDVGGRLGECAAIGASYGALGLAALGGDGSEAEVEGLLDDLDGNIPSELEEPFSVVADAYREFAEQGPAEGTDALEGEEFDQANAEIEAWVEENCTGFGG